MKPAPTALAKEMRFDLSLIRGSLLIDLLSHSLVALSPAHASQALFVGATSLSSFGAGLVPATNSLALCIMQARGEDDTGKLFGAFSVLQAIGQMILGVSFPIPGAPLVHPDHLLAAHPLRHNLHADCRELPEGDLRCRSGHLARISRRALPRSSRCRPERAAEAKADRP